ncbi:MAG: TRAP transporter large permease subunit, partial [Deltaproteobacteria bacterium]|nr:TRAP transporter large permease subunit [Deltaproteobacteria bacterium]
LFVVTIGGIYMGIFSPTEAAAIGALGVIVLGFLGRRLSVRDLIRSLESTVLTSCMLFMIIIAATLFSVFVVQTHLPEVLAETALAMNMPGTLVMTLIVVTYILMGCVLEGIGMMLITVPVFLPLVVHYGYDPVWFGVIVVIVVEVGLMNPPVGMNLFVIQAQAPDVRLRNIYLGILPFLIAPVILIGLLFLFPQIALWFPTWLYG